MPLSENTFLGDNRKAILYDNLGRLLGITASGEAQVAITTGAPAKMVDDAAFTVASSSVSPVGYLADETATDSVDEGDVGAPRMSLDRIAYATALLASDYVRAGGASLAPKFAFANIAASTTDGAVVAAVASKKIRVLALAAVCGGTATTLVFTSKPAGAGSAISPTYANGANGGEALPFSPVGWFETVAGEGLSATTGAGSTTGVQVVYVEVS